MKKGLVLLSLIGIFTACGKKEEASKTDIVAPIVVEQKAEEVTEPVIMEEVLTEGIVVTAYKTSEVIENIEESVTVDVTEATSGEIVAETPVPEKEILVEEASTVTTEEKIAQ